MAAKKTKEAKVSLTELQQEIARYVMRTNYEEIASDAFGGETVDRDTVIEIVLDADRPATLLLERAQRIMGRFQSKGATASDLATVRNWFQDPKMFDEQDVLAKTEFVHRRYGP